MIASVPEYPLLPVLSTVPGAGKDPALGLRARVTGPSACAGSVMPPAPTAISGRPGVPFLCAIPRSGQRRRCGSAGGVVFVADADGTRIRLSGVSGADGLAWRPTVQGRPSAGRFLVWARTGS